MIFRSDARQIQNQQIQALKAAKGGEWLILERATYLDTEHDLVDGSSYEILPTTTDRKAGMGQEEGWHSPLKGEWTHLVGADIYA
jgi:hypothetical protein